MARFYGPPCINVAYVLERTMLYATVLSVGLFSNQLLSAAGDASECSSDTVNACITVGGSALGLFLPTEHDDFNSRCQYVNCR